MRRLCLLLVTVAACAPAASVAPTKPPARATSASVTPEPVTVAATASATAKAAPSAKPVQSKPPCEAHFHPSDGDVAVTWKGCTTDAYYDWFATRGLPAVDREHDRVAVAELRERWGLPSFDLDVVFIDVGTGKRVEVVTLMKEEEMDASFPQGRAAEFAKRAAAATAKLKAFVPMSACAAPLPWPGGDVSSYDACTASPPPKQTIACTSHDAKPRSVTVTMQPPALRVSFDGGKSAASIHDVTSWRQSYDAYQPNGTKKKTLLEPIVTDTFADFEGRALVLQIAYCNTNDSQPHFPSVWKAVRLPNVK